MFRHVLILTIGVNAFACASSTKAPAPAPAPASAPAPEVEAEDSKSFLNKLSARIDEIDKELVVFREKAKIKLDSSETLKGMTTSLQSKLQSAKEAVDGVTPDEAQDTVKSELENARQAMEDAWAKLKKEAED